MIQQPQPNTAFPSPLVGEGYCLSVTTAQVWVRGTVDAISTDAP